MGETENMNAADYGSLGQLMSLVDRRKKKKRGKKFHQSKIPL